jgi:predicted helicase
MSFNSFSDWITYLKTLSHNEHHKGVLFERFMVAYLQTDPLYADQLDHVWRYPEWPDRPDHWPTDNLGIDLVARTKSGDYWAIQCKFYGADSRISKNEIAKFTHDSERTFKIEGMEKTFVYRLFVSTQDSLGKQAEEALTDLPNLGVMYLRNLDLAPIDWSKFTWDEPGSLVLTRKSTRPYQREAIQNVLQGFQTHDRGKLIMACGTGKTFTSLQIMQQMVPNDGLVLFLTPSITLVSQTLREWCAQAVSPIHAFVVCSDSQVGKEDEDIRIADLAYPATTDPQKIAKAVTGVQSDRRKVIFSTYQSIGKVIEAQKLAGFPDFDLVICDEAHRTTGITLKSDAVSEFMKVHRNDLLRAKKRLYMTATPRIYTENTRNKAEKYEAVLYSMDNEKIYGPEFYVLTFGEAASRGILAEYKVILVAVREETMAEIANKYNNAVYKLDDKKAIKIEFATRIIGAWKGLANQDILVINGVEMADPGAGQPMKRAVAFSNSINASEQLRDAFSAVVALAADHKDNLPLQVQLRHMDGSMSMGKRLELLDWLKAEPEKGSCHVLTNARCLSEGVDVPALDAVIFFDARDSMVDIVQAVGRVMRKAEGKEFGYVILPIAIPTENITDYDTYVDMNPRFQSIWKILKALRAHDERLVDKSEYQKRITILDGSGISREKLKRIEAGEQAVIDPPTLPVDKILESLYAVVPKHLGDTEYWASWAQDVAKIVDKVILRIKKLIEEGEGRSAFDAFLKAIRKDLNGSISESEAVEMLAQHLLTRPIFDALFGNQSFSQENPVSQAMQKILGVLDKYRVDSEADNLDRFYKDVAKRVTLAKSDDSRQDLIRNLYDTFFRAAFPRLAERLGIVYTPVEVVDFILHSVQVALQKHFAKDLNSPYVQILDPFTGTGTFISRLLQTDLIDSENLPRKYASEIHANELVLLAYYIAAINIENAYHARTGKYQPFDGIVLTDTFQMNEWKDDLFNQEYLRENSARVEHQRNLPIRVIIGNPPYSVGQKNANDNNQNQKYPKLDERIAKTYAAQSSATLKNSLYASEIKALRWASDRIGDEGVVAFVTNGSFIDGNAADGLRKCMMQEFSHLYVFNLRGAARTQGEQRRKEKGNVFGEGSRNTIAIVLMVKDPAHQGACELRYHDIGDYLDREEKLAIIAEFGSIENIPWQMLTPNEAGDWINQRNPEFDEFVRLGDKGDKNAVTVFETYSGGVKTNRDDWAYNFSRSALESNMQRMIENYNTEVGRYERACHGADKKPDVANVVNRDPRQIKWTLELLSDAGRFRYHVYDPESVVLATYRPFSKQWLYFNRRFNNSVYLMPSIFPTPHHPNLAISIPTIGVTKDFTCLIVDTLPDLNLMQGTKCFPLYWYDKASEQPANGELFAVDGQADAEGYVRRDAITDAALADYQTAYGDTSITKEDLFYHVYGILHAPDYRAKFAADLKKMLPRIPRPADFWAFSKAGRALAELHLNYETVEPWPLEEVQTSTVEDYRVVKMRYPSRNNKTEIIYNAHLTLRGIPPEALEYVVNGKPAIEWVMDRYQVTTDKDSGIHNNPNAWADEHGDPRYIVDLVKRVVRVSVETVKIIKTLPRLESDNMG